MAQVLVLSSFIPLQQQRNGQVECKRGFSLNFAETIVPSASEEELTFVGPHAPHEKAIEAFTTVESQIKHAIIASRKDWDKHEPRMWSRAKGVSDAELSGFTLGGGDLVLVDNAATSYGQIILGKIRIPAIPDGYIHVRYVQITYHHSIVCPSHPNTGSMTLQTR
jgi:hypothetical protein